MNYSEILKKINEILYTLKTHNKNYTKEQYYLILDLQDLINELEAARGI